MEAKLQKWGNSYGIRIPSMLMKSLNLKGNENLNIEQVEDRIVISKSIKQKISLKEKFESYQKDTTIKEYDWGKSVGREIW